MPFASQIALLSRFYAEIGYFVALYIIVRLASSVLNRRSKRYSSVVMFVISPVIISVLYSGYERYNYPCAASAWTDVLAAIVPL